MTRTLRFKPLASLRLSTFVASATALATISGCATTRTDALTDRHPAGETLLRGCGHAPVRLLLDHGIVLRPKADRAGDGKWVSKLACGEAGCATSAEESDPHGLASRRFSGSFHDKSDIAVFEAADGGRELVAGQAFRLTGMRTTPYSQYYGTVLDEEDLFAKEKASGPTIRFVHANRDLTLDEFARFAAPYFKVELDRAECPLTEAQRKQSCENGVVPYDPSEETVERDWNAYRKSDAYKKLKMGEKKDAKQNARGYSYSVGYVDAEGDKVRGSGKQRYTINPFRLFEALTRPLCPGWKIDSVALNAHDGKGPYGKYYDADGEHKQTAEVFANAYEARAEEIIRNYAPRSEVRLNLCYSLNLNDTTNQLRLGNVLMNLDPARNPIGTISGFSGYCYTMSHRAKSAKVPAWIGKIIHKKTGPHERYGTDKDEPSGFKRDTWHNPRFK